MLVGPSGCGKTTAMRMVNRMIDISGGDILVGGRSVRDRDVDDLRREIGYVIQQIGLFPHRTIGDNIATVPRLLGWDKRRIAARVEELIELIGLPQEMAGRYPAQLQRRPAPARRRRPRARRRPAADADGRAVRRDRPDQPRAPPERVPAAAGRDPQDDRLRHARHRRGDQDGRPDRDPAGRRQARAVRAAGGAADGAGVRLRRGLRRCRPRAEGPQPAARARRGPVARGAGEGRRAGGRGAAPDRGRRHPHPAAGRRRRAPARLAGRARPDRRARPRGAALRARSRSSSSTTSCATRSATCSAHGSQYGPVVDDTGKAVGVLSMELLADVTSGEAE